MFFVTMLHDKEEESVFTVFKKADGDIGIY